MARSSGDTLSLNNLAGALGETQNSNVSLNTLNGSANSTVSIDQYGIDSVGSISGYRYLVEGDGDQYTLTFVEAGTKHVNIANQTANFTWTVQAGSYLSKSGAGDKTQTFVASDMNPQSPSAQTVLQTVRDNTIRVVYNDGFNDHATNYNTNVDKTVTAVDSYDGNATALCLRSDSPITKADGTIVQIGDLEEGDFLQGFQINNLQKDTDGQSNFLNWNEDNLEVTPVEVEVKNVVYSFSNKIYNINEGEVRATIEHPFLVKDVNGKFRFLETRRLMIGDSLIKYTESGTEEIEINSIEIETEDVEIVSIDVAEQDTYLVNGYITHNKSGDSHTDLGAPSTVSGLSFSDPNLTWTAVSGASSYRIEIDDASNFSSPNTTYTEWSTNSIRLGRSFNASTENISPVALAAGTWYVRIKAIDHGLLSTNWSSTITLSIT